jgi:hypothetical protein
LAWLTLRSRSILPAVVAHALTLVACYAAAALMGWSRLPGDSVASAGHTATPPASAPTAARTPTALPAPRVVLHFLNRAADSRRPEFVVTFNRVMDATSVAAALQFMPGIAVDLR